jgi:hypothetical protein
LLDPIIRGTKRQDVSDELLASSLDPFEIKASLISPTSTMADVAHLLEVDE